MNTVELREVFCVHRSDQGDAAALQGTTLTVSRGEIVCVLGPSGAGKSTLLRVIAGLQRPSAGIANVLGSDIGRMSARRSSALRHAQIGYLDQRSDSMLAPDLPAQAAVELPLALRGVPPQRRRARARELLAAAGLDERAAALPDQLSGGERQRLALCAALAHRPALLLADEPTGELDAASAATVHALIESLARGSDTTVVLVTHDPAATTIADRTVSIRDGRIVEDRRDGQQALVVGRGGWLQLPAPLLAAAGIGERATATTVSAGVLVSSAGGDGQPVGGAAAGGPPMDGPPLGSRSTSLAATNGRWDAARAELRGVSRSRGAGAGRRRVIDKLSLSIAPGRLTVVTGRSGAGKSTLLRMLAALDRPDEGELSIAGAAVHEYGEEQLARLRLDRIGYLPQEPSPIGFLAAEENVLLALRLRGWTVRDASERAAVALAQVGLADRARQRVARLSAGEAQRVALARALASARGLLIVDEPTSRLDEAAAEAVAELLATAAGQGRQTVVCASHDPQVIRRADEVVGL